MNKGKIVISLCCYLLLLLCLQAFQLPAWGAGDIQRRLEKSIVLFIGNSNAIAKNALTNVDTQNKSVAPLIKDGRTLVPVRFIAENFGANIGWDGATSTVTITQADKVIKLVLGSNIMFANGEEKTLDVPAESIGGRTFIPLRALTNVLGKNLFWDDRGLIVISDEDGIFDREKDEAIVNDVIALVTESAIKASSKDKRIGITIDPRVELISVIQLLSGYSEKYKESMTELDLKYKKKVTEYFAPYKDHNVIKQFSAMTNAKTFSYYLPTYMMLNLSNPPELKLYGKYPEVMLSMAGEYTQLDNLIKVMADFAEKSNFSKFYYENYTLYKEMVDDTNKAGSGMRHIESLEEYLGKQHGSYNFILAPLQKGGFLSWLTKGKQLEYTQVIGTKKLYQDKPVFGDDVDFRLTVWANVSRPFMDILTKQNSKEIDKYSALYKPVEEKMKSKSINTWLSCADANITRAIFIRLLYQEINIDKLLEEYEKDGYKYVRPLAKQLEEYEKNRNKYPTFDSFFPKLIETFSQLSPN